MINKAWSILKNEGVGHLFSAIGSKMYFRHRSIWFEKTLDDSIKVIKPRFDGWLDFDNSEKVAAWIADNNVPGTNDPVEISSMKAKGQLFVGIMDGNDIIGHLKLGWDSVYILDYGEEIKLSPDDYFVIDIYVIPEKHGLGAGPFLVSASEVEMKKRGFKRSVLHVRTNKLPMLKTGERAGLKEIGRVDYISFLGKRFFRPHPLTLLIAGRQ